MPSCEHTNRSPFPAHLRSMEVLGFPLNWLAHTDWRASSTFIIGGQLFVPHIGRETAVGTSALLAFVLPGTLGTRGLRLPDNGSSASRRQREPPRTIIGAQPGEGEPPEFLRESALNVDRGLLPQPVNTLNTLNTIKLQARSLQVWQWLSQSSANKW
ncbi:predicted protein [Histoplasma capsulatum H143]|uniref:Uncharacterized protein n=1 Tax=Ajellomyces capsulatus (strain H143) TaxID=544712 RepID=C6HSS2_AJECH|nr:predicted protein [Histoplasma capsulatum H143]